MDERSSTAFSAVGVLLLLLASALVWGGFGAFGVSVARAWSGG
jgi:hypothetical protein